VGRLVVRFPEQLRMHHALKEIALIGVIDEINEAARLKCQPVLEPILITKNGTILAGYERWQLALFEGRREIDCIEYPLSENESVQFILSHHRTRRGWNPFVRICLALTLESCFQQKALENMRSGGKYKGSASLPEVQRIDVREEIASVAAVGARSVSNTKTILKAAHPRLIAALRESALTINGAIQLCKLPKAEQLEQFIQRSEERATSKVIRRSINRPRREASSLDAVTILDALQQQEVRQPGSVAVQVSRFQRTVVIIGRDLLAGPYSQKAGKLI
jgi:hypothetical protein